METENNPVVPDDDHAQTRRNRQAVMVTLACLMLGVIDNFLFYGQWLGVNLVLYTLLIVVVGVALAVLFELPLIWKHLIFGAPALIFAGFLAVNSNPTLVSMNLLLAVGSLFVFIRFGRVVHFLGGSWVEAFYATLQTFMVSWLEGPMSLLNSSADFLNQRRFNLPHFTLTKAIVRGLLLALPIVLVFGCLLGSADFVFRDLLKDLFGWFKPDMRLVEQLLLILLFTYVSLIMMRLFIFGPPTTDLDAKPLQVNIRLPQVSMIETGIVLGSVNLLFLVFVLLQARYLFGGESNITAQGYTYAEYARRGFYELLAVSVMTMGLIGLLDIFTHRQPGQENLFRFLIITLTALTGVIMVAAWRRLALYEDAYGFTVLRVASGVFMIWLALLITIMLADVLLKRKGVVFVIGVLVCTMGYMGTLNILNMDRYVANHNIDRFHKTGKLDVYYLLTLSDDAVPAMATLLDDPTLPEIDRTTLQSDLGYRLYRLDSDHAERRGVDYHYAKAQAWEALDKYRALLAPYIQPNYDAPLY